MTGIPLISIKQIQSLYTELATAHARWLTKHGVSLPKLQSANRLTQSAVALVGLYTQLGKPVSKDELTEFVRHYAPGARDLQEGRHLGSQRGWHVLSASRGDKGTIKWPRDSYGLMAVDSTLPGWVDPASRPPDWETRNRSTYALLNPELILRSPETVQLEVLAILQKKFCNR